MFDDKTVGVVFMRLVVHAHSAHFERERERGWRRNIPIFCCGAEENDEVGCVGLFLFHFSNCTHVAVLLHTLLFRHFDSSVCYTWDCGFDIDATQINMIIIMVWQWNGNSVVPSPRMWHHERYFTKHHLRVLIMKRAKGFITVCM